MNIKFEEVACSCRLVATIHDRALIEKLRGRLRLANAYVVGSVDLLAVLECLAVCCCKSERSGTDVAVAVRDRKSNFSNRVTCDSTGEVLEDF